MQPWQSIILVRDVQVFANYDFRFGPGLIELMRLDAEGKLEHPLQVGIYNHTSKRVEFTGNFKCVENPATKQMVVEITHAPERPHWTRE